MVLPSSLTRRSICTAGIAVVAGLYLCGCANQAFYRARSDFYNGRFEQAAALLDETNVSSVDEVLFLMERGMVLQNLARYPESSRDFIKAADRLEYLRTYSLSKGVASIVVNDTVQDFTGFPFEQSLLHAFTAKNHLAEGSWDNAAVESRRMINLLSPERLGSYPDDAYSRYIAGLGLELIDDFSNAALQYRKGGELSKLAKIDETGRLSLPDQEAQGEDGKGMELICLVAAGRVPRRGMHSDGSFYQTQPVYAEIYAGGRMIGRSYVLTDTAQLAFTSEQIDAAREAAKTVARVVLKDVAAKKITEQDAFLGAIAHIILIHFLEQRDLRRWETLPRWLGVARIRWEGDVDGLEAVFRTDSQVLKRVPVTVPIKVRRGKKITFVRDIIRVTVPESNIGTK